MTTPPDPRLDARILRLLDQVRDRLKSGTVDVVREFVDVGERQLAAEWIADAIGDAECAITEEERRELLDLSAALDTRRHVEARLARGQDGAP